MSDEGLLDLVSLSALTLEFHSAPIILRHPDMKELVLYRILIDIDPLVFFKDPVRYRQPG